MSTPTPTPTPTITFAFKVLKLNVIPTLTINTTTLTNVVTSIVYQYTGTSSTGQTCVITGEAPLGQPDLNSYTDFNKLTEAEVINWLESTVNINKYQTDITNYLNGNNIVSLPLPWTSS